MCKHSLTTNLQLAPLGRVVSTRLPRRTSLKGSIEMSLHGKHHELDELQVGMDQPAQLSMTRQSNVLLD